MYHVRFGAAYVPLTRATPRVSQQRWPILSLRNLIHVTFRKVLAHVEIMRPYTVCYAGFLALAGASVVSSTRVQTSRALQAALVTMCGWVAGHYVGDYFDRHIDARSKPGRPLPSGRV